MIGKENLGTYRRNLPQYYTFTIKFHIDYPGNEPRLPR